MYHDLQFIIWIIGYFLTMIFSIIILTIDYKKTNRFIEEEDSQSFLEKIISIVF